MAKAESSVSNDQTSRRSLNDDDDDELFQRQLKAMLKDGAVTGSQSDTSIHSGVSADMTFVGAFNKNQSAVTDNRPQPTSQPVAVTTADLCPNTSAPNSPVMTSISLSSPGPAPTSDSLRRSGSAHQAPTFPQTTSPTQSKLEELREWSFSTYKFTRQLVSERLGRVPRTVDAQLEAQITELRETQHKYANVLSLTRTLMTHFHRALQTQQALGDAFGDMSQKNPELREEFAYNSETQKVLARNGDNLLRALGLFSSTLNTLCNKTITDTLQTVKQYEAARVEYDAYRLDVEALMTVPRDAAITQRLDDAQARYKLYKDKYERLRADITIKMKFLDENRIKVMHNQLMLFHNAVAAYFSGNQVGLEETLNQFNIRMKSPNSERLSSFLENHK